MKVLTNYSIRRPVRRATRGAALDTAGYPVRSCLCMSRGLVNEMRECPRHKTEIRSAGGRNGWF